MKKIVFALLALGSLASALVAQPPAPPSGDGHRSPPHDRPPPPVMAALDADGDGVLSAAEIAAASTALLTLDANGDGKLTMDELRPKQPGREGHGPGRPPEPPHKK